MRRQVLSLLVENTFGVVSRISGLFSRRGFNIESFTSGVTMDQRFTRITVCASGDEEVLEQILKQLAKLEDVIDIKELDADNSVCKELILLKLRATDQERQEIVSIANIFRAKISDVSTDSIIIELVGSPNKLNAFFDLVKGYDILELARTGVTGLSRGSADVKIIE